MEKTNESIEDYLERILMLNEKGNNNVHAIHIAVMMGYSKASVSIALKKLESLGYITINEHHVITLTETGKKIAVETYERHRTIGNFFTSLGVDPEIAYKDACKIEHDLSTETYQALKIFLQKIKAI
ncbi:MAG: metal-dependent transcriptional regulator [Candidatus Enterosoma sp.]|nr:metal-dependent transcriptional regulator [Candidatus Enterosoma sp.]MDY5322569.1 metal-dependent transcriptional regulator [Candidatus Enterosoma sp.]MDY5970577.1 metal-dependent transcriptional regulator [Candidatus Enterosoma sp.]